MPFKDDRRTPTASQFIATIVCGALIGAVVLAVSRDQIRPAIPVELKVPPRRPAAKVPVAKSPATKLPTAPAVPSAKKSSPLIRVNLTSTPAVKLQVGLRGPFSVHALDTQRQLLAADALAETDVRLNEGTLFFGSTKLGREPVEIVTKSAGVISINRHSYHGSVRIYPQPSGKLIAVNVLPLEDYLSCVIDAEMPAKFPPAARESQAIVARTYALWQIRQADRNAVYDVFATVRSQKYLGTEYLDAKGRRLAGESAGSRQAAANTRGLTCQAQGRIFCTYYSAVCGGATTPGEQIFSDANPVLKSVRCEWCRESDKYRWRAELTPQELLAAVRKDSAGKKLTAIHSVRQTTGPEAGVISQFQISDGRKTATISGMSLREKLPAGKLLSPHFALRIEGSKITAEGSGFGHGAGFCQWGARGLAASGKSAREIVQYYYPGATIAEDGY